MVPVLRESARTWGTVPVVSIFGSSAHAYTEFPERRMGNVFDGLDDEKNARMKDRLVLPTYLTSLYFVLAQLMPLIATQSPNSSYSS